MSYPTEIVLKLYDLTTTLREAESNMEDKRAIMMENPSRANLSAFQASISAVSAASIARNKAFSKFIGSLG